MDKKRLGVGFIGGGFISRFHIRSWEGVRDADVRGVMDPRLEIAEEAAALARKMRVGDAKAFSSITEMVADPGIDAIWICAPNNVRIQVMEEIVHAVKSGRGELVGVTCEKPLGRNVAEARKMLESGQGGPTVGRISREPGVRSRYRPGERRSSGHAEPLRRGDPIFRVLPRSTAGRTCPGSGKDRCRAGACLMT